MLSNNHRLGWRLWRPATTEAAAPPASPICQWGTRASWPNTTPVQDRTYPKTIDNYWSSYRNVESLALLDAVAHMRKQQCQRIQTKLQRVLPFTVGETKTRMLNMMAALRKHPDCFAPEGLY